MIGCSEVFALSHAAMASLFVQFRKDGTIKSVCNQAFLRNHGAPATNGLILQRKERLQVGGGQTDPRHHGIRMDRSKDGGTHLTSSIHFLLGISISLFVSGLVWYIFVDDIFLPFILSLNRPSLYGLYRFQFKFLPKHFLFP